jgi:hypothetical protein
MPFSHFKYNLMQRISKKWMGRIFLFTMGILLLIRLLTEQCSLLLCGIFVAIIVTYTILSDYGRA